MTEDIKKLIEETRALTDPEKQRIVCAACRWPDGHIVTGVRHYSADMQAQMQKSGYKATGEQGFVEQGFIDQWGNFLDRQVAFKIALRQGQYRPYEPYSFGTLYSEDLY